MFRKLLFREQSESVYGTRGLTLKMLPPAKDVLDVGCGDGVFTQQISDYLKTRVIGADVQPTIYQPSVITDVSGGFPFDDGSFDLVVASQVIEHLDDTDKFVKEIYRVLKIGGKCICATPNLASVHNIVSLLFGYQPFVCHVSDVGEFGELFTPVYASEYVPWHGAKHRRVFAAPSLRGLFEHYGFKCDEIKGYGYYLMPVALEKMITSPKYSNYIVMRATK